MAKNEFSEFVIGGVRFQAFHVSDGCWMIKQLIRGGDFDNQANYNEAELFSDTDDALTAVQQAIARGSWA
jgi:hypothetical protein